MLSTIFAIYCHMLFYSRSASALRVATVESADYQAPVTCTNTKYVLSNGNKYKCQEFCGDHANKVITTRVAEKSINLEKCVAEIGKNNVVAVTWIGNQKADGKCGTYEKPGPKSPQSCSGAKTPAFAIQGGIFGDPHVVNMAGEKFDILTTGTFSLLSLTRATEEDLAINGTVVRFGTKCSQSFIDDLELTGGWIREIYNTKTLKVRAAQDTPTAEALQFNFGQKWQPLADLQEMARVKKTANGIQLDLTKVTVQVNAGKHKHHGWNFLNLDVDGLATLGDNIRIGGLLGYDDHTHVVQADADCAMFASTAETDTQDQQYCLSYLNAN